MLTKENKTIKKTQWTNLELRELNQELEKYRVDCKNKKGETFRYLSSEAERQFLRNKGLLIKENALPYDEMNRKISALNTYLGKVEFAKKSGMKEYEEMAESMEDTPF